MYILGISCYYHDSSATLIKDGRVLAAAQEERFTRKKHDNSFPVNAICFCLNECNLNIEDIDYIGFYEKPLIKFERLLFQYLETFPFSLKTFVTSIPSWATEKLRLVKTIKKKLKYKKGVIFIDHHTAHAASCFFLSRFDKAAILTIDGVGEWTTAAWGVGKNNNIELFQNINFPHSLGLLYSTITAYLGFKVNNSEFKVMGLAAYGEKNKDKNPYYKKILKLVDIKKDGSFRLNMSYFAFTYTNKMPSDKMIELFDGAVDKGGELTKKHKDIAAALQLVTEEIIVKMLNYIHKRTGCDNLVFAGGVALNSVMNGKILKETGFKEVWIQPDASDGGGSMGVAAYIYFSILKNKRKNGLDNIYLGPSFSDGEILSFLEDKGVEYHEFKDKKELVGTTANLIFQNKVVAWFQGRMEWGPRALGSRSILANPCNPEMKNILNNKVKHRESFRPFAPAVCEDDVHQYFDCEKPLSEITYYMLATYPIIPKWRGVIPSVVHVNGTGRLQAVRKNQNLLYYELIKEFGKLSGVPVLINTSFNVRGEPIVCSPFDAYSCMMNTEIDYLVMENFLIKKNNL